jgi:hypothetical protein
MLTGTKGHALGTFWVSIMRLNTPYLYRSQHGVGPIVNVTVLNSPSSFL